MPNRKTSEIKSGPAFWLILTVLLIAICAFLLHALSLADPGNFPEDKPLIQDVSYSRDHVLI